MIILDLSIEDTNTRSFIIHRSSLKGNLSDIHYLERHMYGQIENKSNWKIWMMDRPKIILLFLEALRVASPVRDTPEYLVPVVRRQVLSLSKLPVVVLDLGNIF